MEAAVVVALRRQPAMVAPVAVAGTPQRIRLGAMARRRRAMQAGPLASPAQPQAAVVVVQTRQGKPTRGTAAAMVEPARIIQEFSEQLMVSLAFLRVAVAAVASVTLAVLAALAAAGMESLRMEL